MAEYLNRSDVPLRTTLLEVNFKEKIVVVDTTVACVVEDTVWQEAVVDNLGQYWHDAEKDEIEFFIFYSDKTYLCQKRRLRVDSEDGHAYWKSYAFADASTEEAERIYSIFSAVHTLSKLEKRNKWIDESKKLFDRQFYYEAKYRKYRRQINEMLLYSDWRMLADYEEEFSGEQQMWILWRKKLRKLLPDLETFETPFDAFRHVSTMKFPVDPNVYFGMYPEGKDSDGNVVEYLSTEDQYDKLDFKVSSDFVAANVENIADFVQHHVNEEVYVTQKVYSLIQELEIFKYFPELESSIVKPAPNPPPEEAEYPELEIYE